MWDLLRYKTYLLTYRVIPNLFRDLGYQCIRDFSLRSKRQSNYSGLEVVFNFLPLAHKPRNYCSPKKHIQAENMAGMYRVQNILKTFF